MKLDRIGRRSDRMKKLDPRVKTEVRRKIRL